jgi:hypothetical protein
MFPAIPYRPGMAAANASVRGQRAAILARPLHELTGFCLIVDCLSPECRRERTHTRRQLRGVLRFRHHSERGAAPNAVLGRLWRPCRIGLAGRRPGAEQAGQTAAGSAAWARCEGIIILWSVVQIRPPLPTFLSKFNILSPVFGESIHYAMSHYVANNRKRSQRVTDAPGGSTRHNCDKNWQINRSASPSNSPGSSWPRRTTNSSAGHASPSRSRALVGGRRQRRCLFAGPDRWRTSLSACYVSSWA